MRLFNHRYETNELLGSFIDDHPLLNNGTLLIQVFSGIMDKNAIQPVLDLLKARFPNAALIGATTAGEIMDGVMSSSRIVISFSLFDATDVIVRYYPKSDYATGEQAAQEVLSKRTKACIVLSEALKSDAESFLEGFSSVRSDVMIAGGNAGDDLTFMRTYIFEGDTIHEEGVVIAVLDSDVLQVNNFYSLYWTPIGKVMTVTKADKNIIYEIDGRKVKELYTYYLGAETVERIPASAIEFPLVKIEDGVQIARSLIAQTEDGGFVYAGHFKTGDKVRFSIGNVEDILNHSIDIRNDIAACPAEATYIYSCSVRKLFLQEQLNYEFGLIEQVAPTAGFFTYGEFFHAPADNKLLNITTTTLSLSESGEVHWDGENKNGHTYRHTMLKSLTHLVNKTQSELDDTIRFLDQYKMVLDESSIVSKTDAKGLITYVNDAFCNISGYTRAELIGKNHNIVRHPDTPEELFVNLWQTISSGKVWKDTFKNLSKDGREYYLKSVIAPIFDDNGEIIEYISARADVTDLITKDLIIERQLKDTLTGLRNRTAFIDDLENAAEEVTLVLLNIDHFSTINDIFGYEVGDRLLKAFAEQVDSILDHERIYRISVDEFAIICHDWRTDDEVQEIIPGHINELENHKYRIGEYELSVNLSGGVAMGRKKEVYNQAHMALKEAKEENVKVVFYNDNSALKEKMRNNILLTNKIKSAIDGDRIVPYFQGITDNLTRRIVKFESLIRLIEENGNVMSPYGFIEHAKKTKMYDQLTRIMITKTFAAFEQNDFEFSFNLTHHDIVSETTRMFLYDTLMTSPAADRCVFELVESEGIQNYELICDFIKTVKQHGAKIAIDDFGSGYSNFNYLSKLDVDYIKIDGSLIKNLTKDKDHLLTVESILFFARRKGIKTIAEFVDDTAVFDKLVALGIDFSQGYLFSKPNPQIISTIPPLHFS